MRSTRTTSGTGVRGAGWTLVIVTLLVAATLGLVACGGSGSSGDATSAGGGSGGQSGGDSFMKAVPVAQEAVATDAPDAMLLTAGTAGLALADVPDSWSFSYFSPAKNSIYMVDVEHGVAGEPRDLAAAEGVKVTPGTDVTTIKVGAADAVVKAREFAQKSGEVPKNVLVAGSFADTPNAIEAGYVSGVWTVTFATGTDLADAQAYSVDMMTGEVTKVKSK